MARAAQQECLGEPDGRAWKTKSTPAFDTCHLSNHIFLSPSQSHRCISSFSYFEPTISNELASWISSSFYPFLSNFRPGSWDKLQGSLAVRFCCICPSRCNLGFLSSVAFTKTISVVGQHNGKRGTSWPGSSWWKFTSTSYSPLRCATDLNYRCFYILTSLIAYNNVSFGQILSQWSEEGHIKHLRCSLMYIKP